MLFGIKIAVQALILILCYTKTPHILFFFPFFKEVWLILLSFEFLPSSEFPLTDTFNFRLQDYFLPHQMINAMFYCTGAAPKNHGKCLLRVNWLVRPLYTDSAHFMISSSKVNFQIHGWVVALWYNYMVRCGTLFWGFHLALSWNYPLRQRLGTLSSPLLSSLHINTFKAFLVTDLMTTQTGKCLCPF